MLPIRIHFIYITLIVTLLTQGTQSYAQSEEKQTLVYRNDTLPVIHIPEINIYDLNKFNYLKARKYRRLIYNVKRAYPYALLANARLQLLDSQLVEIESKKERKKFMNEEEKKILDEFEDDLRKLTVKQGIILVKLIDRETNQTSYKIIKDLRGGITAFFWQGIAKFFGNNLKAVYDPEGADKTIEDILTAIDLGFI